MKIIKVKEKYVVSFVEEEYKILSVKDFDTDETVYYGSREKFDLFPLEIFERELDLKKPYDIPLRMEIGNINYQFYELERTRIISATLENGKTLTADNENIKIEILENKEK